MAVGRAARKRRAKPLNPYTITGIENKIRVTGFRGEWDVELRLQLGNGFLCPYPVRQFSVCNFRRFERRDEAREQRDGCLCALAKGERVYVEIPNTSFMQNVVRKEATFSVVSIDPSLFSGTWKNAAVIFPVKAGPDVARVAPD